MRCAVRFAPGKEFLLGKEPRCCNRCTLALLSSPRLGYLRPTEGSRPMDQGYRMLGFVVIVILYAVIGLMAAAGAIFIARKVLAPKAEQIFYAMFLIMIAAFYLALRPTSGRRRRGGSRRL